MTVWVYKFARKEKMTGVLAIPQDGQPSLSQLLKTNFDGRDFVTCAMPAKIPSPAEIHVVFKDSELTPGELTTLQTIYNTSWQPFSLDLYKLSLMVEMERHCGFIIEEGPGFEYPPASGQFLSTTRLGQLKWTNLNAIRSEPGITYPLVVRTKDNKTQVSLADAAAINAAYLIMAKTVMGYLESLSQAKEAVWSALDAAGAKAACDAYLQS